MDINNFKIRASDGLNINVVSHICKKPIASVILIHGAYEYGKRYDDLASFLCNNGYNTYALDLRGHGLSVNDKYIRGYMDNVDEMIDDIKLLYDKIKNDTPNLKIFIFGHSMGSLFARLFMFKYDTCINGLILTGTVCPNIGAYLMKILSKLVIFFRGSYGKDDILNVLPNNKDWISYNKENIERIYADEMELKHFLNNGNLVLYDAVIRITKPMYKIARNGTLPILSLTGKDDIITGFKYGLLKSIRQLKRAGYKNVKFIIFKKMKHEVINEKDNIKIYKTILKFLDNISKK